MKDGTVFPVEISSGTFMLGDRKIISAIIRNIAESKKTEGFLREIAERVSDDIGEAYFDSLVTFLARTLNTEYAFISTISDEHADSIRTMAFYAGGKIVENFEYSLSGTPCAEVVGKKICCYEEKVQEKFPDNTMLAEMGIESYIGSPLFNSKMRPLGLIVVMDKKPFRNTELAESLFTIFSSRLASEIERKTADTELKNRVEELEELKKLAVERDLELSQLKKEIKT